MLQVQYLNVCTFHTLYCPQLMRFEFTATSTRRPSAFDAARQAKLNAALLAEAVPDLPPTTRPVRQMALIEEVNPADGRVTQPDCCQRHFMIKEQSLE